MPRRTEDTGARVTHVVLTGRSADATDVIRASPDARIRLDAARLRGRFVTLVGLDGRALRMTADAAARHEDLAAVEIPAAEFPAGIAGQAWDAAEERPVAPGTVALHRKARELAVRPLAADGAFAFDMTPSLPLEPGRYVLVVQAPGYAPSSREVEIAGTTTSWRLGRIPLVREPVR